MEPSVREGIIMLWYKREEMYIAEIKDLQKQLREKNQIIEEILKREQELLQENYDSNTQTLELLKIVLEKVPQ